MPTSTSRGRHNWTCSAALKTEGIVVVAGLCDGILVTVVCTIGVVTSVGVVGVGNGLAAGVVEIKVGVVGTGIVLTGGVVGTGTGTGTVGVGGGSVFVTGGGGGALIVVGPPTGPVQTSPSGQHPMIPLLASSQTV